MELRVHPNLGHGNPVISNLRKLHIIPTGYIYWVCVGLCNQSKDKGIRISQDIKGDMYCKGKHT